MRDNWNWTWWKVCSHFSIQCKPSKNQASGTVPKCVFCSPHGLMSFVSEVSDEKGAERSSPCLWAAGCHGSSQGLTQHVLLLPTHLLWPNVGGTTNGWAFSLGESEFFCSSLTVLDSFHPHSCSASGTGTVVYQRGRDGGQAVMGRQGTLLVVNSKAIIKLKKSGSAFHVHCVLAILGNVTEEMLLSVGLPTPTLPAPLG